MSCGHRACLRAREMAAKPTSADARNETSPPKVFAVGDIRQARCLSRG